MCEYLLAEIEPLARGRARICVRDVDERPDWQSAYGDRIPVVCWGGQEICEYRLDRRAVWDTIAAGDGNDQTPGALDR